MTINWTDLKIHLRAKHDMKNDEKLLPLLLELTISWMKSTVKDYLLPPPAGLFSSRCRFANFFSLFFFICYRSLFFLSQPIIKRRVSKVFLKKLNSKNIGKKVLDFLILILFTDESYCESVNLSLWSLSSSKFCTG